MTQTDEALAPNSEEWQDAKRRLYHALSTPPEAK